MPNFSAAIPTLAVLGGIVVAAVASAIAKRLLGISPIRSNAMVAWRFSLASISGLVAICAMALGVLRDSPAEAMAFVVFCSLAWLSIIRYREFARALRELRRRKLLDILRQREHDEATTQFDNGLD